MKFKTQPINETACFENNEQQNSLDYTPMQENNCLKLSQMSNENWC